MKFHNLLVIASVIIRHTHKAHRTDRGAENPTGPKLPDFTLSMLGFFLVLLPVREHLRFALVLCAVFFRIRSPERVWLYEHICAFTIFNKIGQDNGSAVLAPVLGSKCVTKNYIT